MGNERKTLLLYSTCEPYAIVSWKDAVLKYLNKKGEILHSYDWIVHPYVNNCVFYAPAVLKLNFADGKRFMRCPRLTRINVFLRDAYTCQYCGFKGTKKQLTCDHVVPKSRGGTLSWNNVVAACYSCNHKKGNKTLTECGLTLVRQPQRPSSFKMFLDGTVPEAWKFYIDR